MDSQEINRLLLGRFDEFCSYIFPNGKKQGNLFLIGGLDGSEGQSLQITLSGAAAGRFKDFANPDHDKGATPIYLLSKAKGKPYAEAIKEAKEWLGIKDDDFGVHRHKQKEWKAPSPADRNGNVIAEANGPAMDYLVGERRLCPKVVAEAKIGESKDGSWIVFPYFDRGAKEAFHIKKLGVERPDGKKQITASTGTRRGLYGKHLIDEDVSELTITEGEIDALSWISYGIPAVSMPNGVSDLSWIETEWEWLERFERINVCPDMDEPGRLVAPDICKRLGLHRTYIVSLPKKDTNECLMERVPREDMVRFLAEAKPIEMDEIRRPNEYTEEVYEYFETDWSKRGWETPWYPSLPWRVRKAEFTIWSGFSGHGKTIGLNHLILHLIQQGCKIMDSSLEIKPGMTLYNMTRCALAKKNATRAEIKACHEWLNDSMVFHDCIGTVNVDRLIHAMEYARKRHGIDVFVIDSLFKCGLSSEDYGGQRAFADKLTTFCNNTGAHVILVAHSRKVSSGNELNPPTKSDVSGSSDLTNAAFNVIIQFRYKLKKQKLDEARQVVPPDEKEIFKWQSHPDGMIILDKQRFGDGEEARVNVWLNHEAIQFHVNKPAKYPFFRLE